MKACRQLLTVVMITLLTACAATKQGAVPEDTGFLRSPELLKPGKPGQAERVYFKPGVDWSSYDKVLLDPVTLWRGRESQMTGVTPAQAQHMADYFYQLIHAGLAKDFQMVTSPQPNTLRISVAIIKLKEADVAMETVSTVVPQARLISSLASAGSGKPPSFVGQASVQVKVVDAETNELLGEGSDARVGGQSLSSVSMDSWTDVENIMKFWVARTTYNLCKARKGTDCVAPPG
jgi:hypothetical protein